MSVLDLFVNRNEGVLNTSKPSSDSSVMQKGIELHQLFSVLKRRKKSFVLTFVSCAFLSLLVIVLYPATYQSRSTILIEQQEIPKDLVRSTVTSYADQRIEVISQRVMTTANLWSLIKKYKLYEDELKRETRESVILDMRKDAIQREVISADVVDPRSGRPTRATIAFQLAFAYESPRLAQKVTNELTSLFLSENLKSRSEMAEQASSFLDAEAEKLGARVTELENSLAEFKEQNFESLPELTKLNLSLLDRAEQSLLDNQRQLNLVQERIAFLRSELAQIEPEAPLLRGNGQLLLSNTARLRALNNELVQAQARYSDDHPQVRRLKDELSALLELVGDDEVPVLKLEIYERQYAGLLSRYSTSHPSVVSLAERITKLETLAETQVEGRSVHADNPAYLQINGQLKSAQIEHDGLIERKSALQSELQKYESRLSAAPRIEQEYQKLQRDYQSTMHKYSEIKAKQQEAALGRSLESEQKSERFTLIEPPLVPEEAYSPNRKLLAILGLVLTLGMSVAVVALKEVIDPSIRGRERLKEVLGAPPLAVIPVINTSHETAMARRFQYLILGCTVLSIATFLVLFHLFVKPLDVTWFVAMRKLGLM